MFDFIIQNAHHIIITWKAQELQGFMGNHHKNMRLTQFIIDQSIQSIIKRTQMKNSNSIGNF